MGANPPTWHWYIIRHSEYFSNNSSGHYKQKSNDFLWRIWKNFPNLFLCKNSPSLWPQPTPWGPWFELTWMCTTFERFNTSFRFSDQMVFSRLLKSILALIFLCKSWTPVVGLPTALPGHPGVNRIQCTLSFDLFNLSLQWWQKYFELLLSSLECWLLIAEYVVRIVCTLT